MTFGNLYAYKRHVFVSTPPLAPVAEYEPYAIKPRFMASGQSFGLTARELRTAVQMRRGGFTWASIADRLRYNSAAISRAYARLPPHLR